LTVPYFSTVISATDKTYKLDSIYGTGKINLKIFESSKFIKTIDPQTLLGQRYFSDEFSVFNSTFLGNFLNNSTSASENSEFVFSSSSQEETTVTDGVDKTDPVTPRMKLQLDKAYFENMLKTAKAQGKLATNDLFKEYFRALFFKVENVGTEKSLAMLNFSQGKIRVYYKETSDGKRKTLDLKMFGNSVNLFQNQYKAGLPTNTTPAVASENLYLKGGAGYHSYIDLFGNADGKGVIVDRSEINSLKANNWLINEANLVFTMDETNPSGEKPKRIYIYDAKNKRPVYDYATDQSTSNSKPKYSKTTHGGIYSEVKNAAGVVIARRYKIKITDHIKNIINKDSTNVRLGLSVTEDIAKIGNRYMKNTPDNSYFNSVPEASVINPLGIILWGNTSNVPDDKKVKLEIFYTKPN
jgi:hypothetical protein